MQYNDLARTLLYVLQVASSFVKAEDTYSSGHSCLLPNQSAGVAIFLPVFMYFLSFHQRSLQVYLTPCPGVLSPISFLPILSYTERKLQKWKIGTRHDRTVPKGPAVFQLWMAAVNTVLL